MTQEGFKYDVSMSIYKNYRYTQVDRSKYQPLKKIKYTRIQDDPGFDREVYNVTFPNLGLPDDHGYYTESILRIINSDRRSYLNIINIGVGQGKTTAIYKLIQQYYEEGYKVIVASPYHTLVEKDYNAIISGNILVGRKSIPHEKVFKFSDLSEYSSVGTYNELSEKDIHVMTINMLLGNPGSDNMRQAEHKREYLRVLQEKWKSQGREVVIIFDEIHESIHNFKPELIFNLFGWLNMVYQCYFVTATVTEPVKFAAYPVAALTDLNIRVIEADRQPLPPSRNSSLDIYIASSPYVKKNGDDVSELNFLFDYMTEFGSPITHVLCYSKDLAKELSREFKRRGIDHEKLVSTDSRKASFDPTKSTIGTTMKTGIDVTAQNHLFVIILPL